MTTPTQPTFAGYASQPATPNKAPDVCDMEPSSLKPDVFSAPAVIGHGYMTNGSLNVLGLFALFTSNVRPSAASTSTGQP